MADNELSPEAQSVGRDRVLGVVLVVLAVLVVGGVLGGLAYLLVGDDSSALEVPAVTAERVELTLGATTQPFRPNRACGVGVPVDNAGEAAAARLARALPRMVPPGL